MNQFFSDAETLVVRLTILISLIIGAYQFLKSKLKH